uniref:Uncharacterized protein n=1 Tax=Chromera velia CCMP2878 TaxID=1169474 RepID=A0A0G4GTA5_9ALVE|eukprot:Cvel_23306.t1-p1 / transcript=Cvel_23306.t1 / gene=Cvel_23306 / organism=Chromera_velia_CCMP2878 / gene_product=hypothetical protein / transcript_product=hypothetical protein / location=Cvel_scaffold2387:1218-3231(+) / protein_length=600 / sequence_SO=supercontig / SO=protein_coding / is_pseudo=false
MHPVEKEKNGEDDLFERVENALKRPNKINEDSPIAVHRVEVSCDDPRFLPFETEGLVLVDMPGFSEPSMDRKVLEAIKNHYTLRNDCITVLVQKSDSGVGMTASNQAFLDELSKQGMENDGRHLLIIFNQCDRFIDNLYSDQEKLGKDFKEEGNRRLQKLIGQAKKYYPQCTVVTIGAMKQDKRRPLKLHPAFVDHLRRTIDAMAARKHADMDYGKILTTAAEERKVIVDSIISSRQANGSSEESLHDVSEIKYEFRRIGADMKNRLHTTSAFFTKLQGDAMAILEAETSSCNASEGTKTAFAKRLLDKCVPSLKWLLRDSQAEEMKHVRSDLFLRLVQSGAVERLFDRVPNSVPDKESLRKLVTKGLDKYLEGCDIEITHGVYTEALTGLGATFGALSFGLLCLALGPAGWVAGTSVAGATTLGVAVHKGWTVAEVQHDIVNSFLKEAFCLLKKKCLLFEAFGDSKLPELDLEALKVEIAEGVVTNGVSKEARDKIVKISNMVDEAYAQVKAKSADLERLSAEAPSLWLLDETYTNESDAAPQPPKGPNAFTNDESDKLRKVVGDLYVKYSEEQDPAAQAELLRRIDTLTSLLNGGSKT